MRKLTTFLLSLCLLATILGTLTVPTLATEKDFLADYFPTGKIQAPEAPYVKNEAKEADSSTELELFYEQVSELQKLALDIQEGGESFYEQYGIGDIDTYLQVDSKFNDGAWYSAKGEWDKLDERGDVIYGENVQDLNGAFAIKGEKHAADAAKMLYFRQAAPNASSTEGDENAFFSDYVKTRPINDVDVCCYFDFSEITISYRIRWAVKCIYTDESKSPLFIVGDWSPVVSFGKDGTQQELKMPEKLDAPVISDFKNIEADGDNHNVKYFIEIPDSIYEAEKYCKINEDINVDNYSIESQIKVGNGEWTNANTADGNWLINGERTIDVDGSLVKPEDDVWLRVRIVRSNDESEHTEWSNIIGTKAYEGTNDTTSPEGTPTGEPTEHDKTEKSKCKVCGICPVQPLGICLFIWLAFILVVILVIIIVVANKKKDKKKNQ